MNFKELVTADIANALRLVITIVNDLINDEYDDLDSDKLNTVNDNPIILTNSDLEVYNFSNLEDNEINNFLYSLNEELNLKNIIVDGIFFRFVKQSERYQDVEFETIFEAVEFTTSLGFVKINGYHDSYDGARFSDDIVAVKPVERMVTFYEDLE